MIRMAIQDAARILGIESGDSHPFEGICTDSRRVQKDMLFAALPGERSDGHDYASQAVAAGACALLVSRPVAADVPQLVVEDVLMALGQLAGSWRQGQRARVAAITGSNGKTTTKEMLASILGTNAEVLATSGNYNNELGLPLTLFELDSIHDFAVLEMGASKAGDIRYLAGIAKPEVGLITNVGPAHLRGFGDEEGVARAKGELYSSLPAEGFAVINGDEPWAPLWHELARAAQVLTFGLNEGCDVHAVSSGSKHAVHTPAGSFELRLRLPGEHNLLNALAATAMATALDQPVDRIAEGLAATQPVPGRLNVIESPSGWTVIDDTYNANPASLYAALKVLRAQAGEPWLVLGDMKELGSASRKLHAEMGEAAATLGVKRLFAIGDASEATVSAFGEGGMHFSGHSLLVEALLQELRPEVVCLVKGSRSMAMEQIVESISEPAGALKETG